MPLERVIEYLWWALRYLDVGGVHDSDSDKAMYEGTITRVKVDGRKVFSVRVGVHQGSVLIPLLLVLFVIVLEGLSIEKSDKACS